MIGDNKKRIGYYEESKFRITIKKALFILGIAFICYFIASLVETIIVLAMVDWTQVEISGALVLSLIISCVISLTQMIIGVYAIYSRKFVDEVINPLWTISIIYLILSTLSFASYMNQMSSHNYPLFETVFVSVDLALAVLLFIYTFILKVEDWLPTELD